MRRLTALSIIICAAAGGCATTTPEPRYYADPAGCLWVVTPRGDLLPVRVNGEGTRHLCILPGGGEKPHTGKLYA